MALFKSLPQNLFTGILIPFKGLLFEGSCRPIYRLLVKALFKSLCIGFLFFKPPLSMALLQMFFFFKMALNKGSPFKADC